jgi:hypothetical protein
VLFLPIVTRIDSKVVRNFNTYHANTGKVHSLAEGIGQLPTGSVPLTAPPSYGLWYGDIQIGTPLKTFTGMYGLFCLVIKAAV